MILVKKFYLFKLENGKTSRFFINELSLWLDHYNRGTDFK